MMSGAKQRISRIGLITVVVAVFSLIGCDSTETQRPQRHPETSKRLAPSALSAEERQVKIDVDIDVISNALEVYKKDHGAYPTDQEELQILLTPRTSGINQGKPYIAILPKTPWGRD